jgi:uncharacterized protein (DUF4415 family)
MSDTNKPSRELVNETRSTGDWTDDEGEVRELTKAEIASMQPFSSLPAELQATLRGLRGTVAFSADEDKVSVPVSRSVVEGFRAYGEDWQRQVDRVLRQWLEQHQAS